MGTAVIKKEPLTTTSVLNKPAVRQEAAEKTEFKMGAKSYSSENRDREPPSPSSRGDRGGRGRGGRGGSRGGAAGGRGSGNGGSSAQGKFDLESLNFPSL